MLEHYYRANEKKRVAWLSESPASPWLDGFAGWLHCHGYGRDRGRRHLHAAAHLSRWAAGRGTRVDQLDDAAVADFRRHLMRCRCLGERRPAARVASAGAGRFVEYLRSICAVAPPPPPAYDPLVEGFVRWARGQRGVAESTLRVWTGLVAGFVAALGNEPDAYDAESIRRFVTERAEGRSVEHADTVVTVVRAFLRYLVAYGRVPAALVGAVPKVAKWKLSALPRYLSVEQVEAVIAACDPGSQVGARDRAMVLLMARLGLRAGDVVALCLDDLDWSGGRVRLVGKSRQQSWLPLPQEVGDAVLHYLQHARPRTRHERVFLRVNAPYVPLAESSAVTGVATRAMRRAGIDAPRLGAHVLRHSAATHALRDGATLETVAVLLRHSSLESTAHYAKVDVGLLREVAQPWPTLELSPC